MIVRRPLTAVLAVLCAVLALVVAPAANAALASAATAKVLVCNQAVALGSTTPCDVPAGGGTARYRFSVPGADTVRFRAAVPVGNPGRALVLSKADGTEICSKASFPQFDCAVPAGGNYRLDVTLSEGATVYTTVDTVLSATCGGPIDTTVGNSGSTVHIADPGSSWCAGLDVAAGEGLEMVLDVNTDQGLQVSVYDDAGRSLCEISNVNAFTRPGCLLVGGGDGYRLFASPYDDTAQDAVLIVTQITHPVGCVNRPLDPFGVPASRQAVLAAHQQRCYRVAGAAGHGVGGHLFALSGPSGTLFWRLVSVTGAQICSGGAADSTHRLTACTLPADGDYYVFVSMLAREDVRYALSLVDLSSDAGCSPTSSTKWNTAGDSRTLTGLGEVDCSTLTGHDRDIVRASVTGDTITTYGLLTTADGVPVCEVVFRAECWLPAAGTYRLAVSTTVRTAVDYRDWVIDESSTAGCRATTPDAFGVAPDRRARFSDNVAVCYRFSAPPPRAAYFFRTTPVTHDIGTVAQIRSTDGGFSCTQPGCPVPADGEYLYVVTKSSFIDDPDDVGLAVAGLWRLDQPAGCAAIGTSFAGAPATGSLAGAGQVDCHQFTIAAGDRIVTRTTPSQYEVTSQVFDRDGTSVCFVVSSTCTLTGTGPYRVLSSARGKESVDYKLRIASLTAAKGCTDLAPTIFGRAPTRAFDIADPVDLRCYRISMPDFGRIGLRMVDVTDTTFHPTVALYGNGASGSCSVSSEFGACQVLGPDDYLLVASSDEPANGTLGWLDLTSTAGCTSASTLAFGTAPQLKRISKRGAIVCTTLPLTARDKARFAFGPSAPGAGLQALLLDRLGLSTCDFRSTDQFPANCTVRPSDAGPERLVVYANEQGSAFTGTVRMHEWRLNNPTGCTDLGSLHNGFGPLVGSLADNNDVACYVARGSTGGTLSITTANDDVPADVPMIQVYRSSGLIACGVTGAGSCVLPASDTYAFLVQRNPSDADFTGTYRVQGTCTSTKCGP
jgi:hypothetical protein